ncbi:hypothetical protein CDAR_62921 [Caerostris darwini]|uniref:Uncharacterized protein n=1 Tax=Caerostris darwini TaxID=1538125 RepID=A0AAV4UF94_9ARAC|nr:hypothetical protein CDAR_62921 [Caerostris darwini]
MICSNRKKSENMNFKYASTSRKFVSKNACKIKKKPRKRVPFCQEHRGCTNTSKRVVSTTPSMCAWQKGGAGSMAESQSSRIFFLFRGKRARTEIFRPKIFPLKKLA